MSQSGMDSPGRTRPLVWLQGVLCGMLAAVAPGTALLVSVLLAPGLFALWSDRQPGRPSGRAVMLFSLAGCVRPLHALWSGHADLSAAAAALGGHFAVPVAWMAGAGGWLMTQTMPVVTRAALDAVALSRVSALTAERARIAEAWDFAAGTR